MNVHVAPAAFGRLARLASLLSAFLAIALQAWLESSLWRGLLWQTGLMLIMAFACARWAPSSARAVLVGATMWAPLLLWLASGYRSPTVPPLWAAAVLGVILAGGVQGWSIPRGWALVIALWGLTVALCWPIVAARELDFYPALIGDAHTGITSGGIPASVQVVWVTSVALSLMLPLLWLDALVGVYRTRDRFERDVVLPLGVASGIAGALGAYQLIDVTFLNKTFFGHLGRAGGTLLDGNAYGVAMALGAAVSATLAVRPTSLIQRAMWVLATAAMLAGVWASASRTAALVALVVLAACGWLLLRRYLSTIVAAALIAVLMAGAAGGLALAARSGMGGPLARLGQSLDERSHTRAWSRVAVDLWERDGYGTAALRFLEVSPLFGVGVGSFHALVIDHSRQDRAGLLSPDNAQNWPRHQLAEHGILGSIGWLIWMLLFAGLLWKTRTGWTSRVPLLAVAALGGLAAASQLGMPTQNAIVGFVAWTLVAWLLLQLTDGSSANARRELTWPWIGVWGLALLCAAGTAWKAKTDLRVPHRALAAGWPYSYGLYPLDGPQGSQFRWTRERAVAVLPARFGYLRVDYWVHHPDVAHNPVRVRIWRGDELVADTTFTDQNSQTVFLFNRGSRPWMMLTVETSRTWSPHGEARPRALGAGLSDWQFVARPPDGATVVN